MQNQSPSEEVLDLGVDKHYYRDDLIETLRTALQIERERNKELTSILLGTSNTSNNEPAQQPQFLSKGSRTHAQIRRALELKTRKEK